MKKRVLQGNGLSFGAFEHGDGERVALLLHGFPDDPTTFFPVIERLANAGFRCIAPYMRGYGETDKGPGGDYHVSDLARDAVGLAETVAPGKRFVLIGHDWGAAAAYAAASLSPERFSHVVTLAVPPGIALRRNLLRNPGQFRKSWYMAFFQAPALSEWTFARNDFALLERLWRDWSPGWRWSPEHLASVKGTFRVPGTVQAALRYYRAAFRPPATAAARKKSLETIRLMSRPLAIPGLVLAGANDGCIGIDMYDGWQAGYLGRCELRIVADAGHFMQCERPDDVAGAIVDFVAA